MDSLVNRSMRTQDVYVGTFPRFIRMETYDGPAWRLISTLCGESATRNLANHSMRIQDLYVGTVPIPWFIKE